MVDEIKMKKICANVGKLDWIEIPNDWHKCEGIVAPRWETNAALSTRDYNAECKTGNEPLMIVEGFWIWWCKTHNQLRSRCDNEKLKKEIKDIEKSLGWLGYVKKETGEKFK